MFVSKFDKAVVAIFVLTLALLSSIGPAEAAAKKKAARKPARRVCTVTKGVGKITPADKPILMAIGMQECGALWCPEELIEDTLDVFCLRVHDPRFPNTARGVATQPGQYGNLSKTGVRAPKPQTPAQWQAYRRVEKVVDKKIRGEYGEVYHKGCVFQALFRQGEVVKIVAIPGKKTTYFCR